MAQTDGNQASKPESRFASPQLDSLVREIRIVQPVADDSKAASGEEPAESACPPAQNCCCPSSDSILTRPQITGDWGGLRSSLMRRGIIYQGSLSQFYQGNTTGGAQRTDRYGAKIDQFVVFDSKGLGLWEGGKLILHAESAFGQNAVLDAAGLAPANTAFLTPRLNDTPLTAITNLTYEQAIGGGYAVAVGRFNLIDLWSQFYPDFGRGIDGFMNTSSFVFLNVGPTLPIIFNGAGLIKAGEKGIEAAVMVLDPVNIPTISGVSDLFEDGTTLIGTYRIFTEFGGLPGSHQVVGTYSNRRFRSFQRSGWSFQPGTGITGGAQTGSWLAAYVGTQHLWMDPCNPKRRVYFMTTMGWADKKTSPYQWAGTYSIEAFGLNPSRPHDRMGISYFYSHISNDLQNLVRPLRLGDVQGGEIYYNMQITPAFNLTLDLQVIEPALRAQNTALVLGTRGVLRF